MDEQLVLELMDLHTWAIRNITLSANDFWKRITDELVKLFNSYDAKYHPKIEQCLEQIEAMWQTHVSK